MFIMKLLKVYYNRSMKRIRAKIGRNLEKEIPVILAVMKVLYDNDMLEAIDELAKLIRGMFLHSVHAFILIRNH